MSKFNNGDRLRVVDAEGSIYTQGQIITARNTVTGFVDGWSVDRFELVKKTRKTSSVAPAAPQEGPFYVIPVPQAAKFNTLEEAESAAKARAGQTTCAVGVFTSLKAFKESVVEVSL